MTNRGDAFLQVQPCGELVMVRFFSHDGALIDDAILSVDETRSLIVQLETAIAETRIASDRIGNPEGSA